MKWPSSFELMTSDIARSMTTVKIKPQRAIKLNRIPPPDSTNYMTTASSFTDDIYIGNSRINNMVGIVFCQPAHELTETEILKNLEYFHSRSATNVHFLFAGYGHEDDLVAFKDKRHVADVDGKAWFFSSESFNNFRANIQANSKWKYQGESELLLMNAFRTSLDENATIDFDTVMVCHLNEMKRLKAITSVMQFFEKIFDFTEEENSNPVQKFSNTQGLLITGETIKEAVLSLLPKTVNEDAKKAMFFVTKSIKR